jgi:hypothetical protein
MASKDGSAIYIAGLRDQLAKLARKNGFDLGAYLLVAAFLEFRTKGKPSAKHRANEGVNVIKHSLRMCPLMYFNH